MEQRQIFLVMWLTSNINITTIFSQLCFNIRKFSWIALLILNKYDINIL